MNCTPEIIIAALATVQNCTLVACLAWLSCRMYQDHGSPWALLPLLGLLCMQRATYTFAGG